MESGLAINANVKLEFGAFLSFVRSRFKISGQVMVGVALCSISERIGRQEEPAIYQIQDTYVASEQI